MRHLSLLAAWLVIAVIAGCAKPWNESIDLVGTPPLAALTDAPPTTGLRPEPSLPASLVRASWPRSTVGVPTHQVRNYPNYVSLFRWDKDRGPYDPAYPEAAGSIVDQTNAGADAADAAFQPVWAAGLLLWAPIDMILGNWPWVEHRSPDESYERVRARTHADVSRWFALPAREPDLGPLSPAPH